MWLVYTHIKVRNRELGDEKDGVIMGFRILQEKFTGAVSNGAVP